MSGNKKENVVPNETNDEMEPRRSGKSAAQKARDLQFELNISNDQNHNQ